VTFTRLRKFRCLGFRRLRSAKDVRIKYESRLFDFQTKQRRREARLGAAAPSRPVKDRPGVIRHFVPHPRVGSGRPCGRSTSMRRSQGVTGTAEIDSAKNSKASRSHAFDWPASEPAPRACERRRGGLGLLRDHLAVLPKIYGGAVHTGDFSSSLRRSAQPATDSRGKAFRFFGSFAFCSHGPCSRRFGDSPELSNIVQ